MPISIICSQCKKKLTAPDSAAGKKVRCAGCKAVVAVPALEEELVTPDEELVAPDDDLVEPETNIAVVESASAVRMAKNAAAGDDSSDAGERKNKVEGGYGLDEDDERDRKRRKKKDRKKRHDDNYGDLRRPSYAAHRGALILTLGILSIVMACAPIIAWIIAMRVIGMADEDLQQMSSRRMDASGQGVTQTGKILAVVGSVLALIWLVIAIALTVLTRT